MESGRQSAMMDVTWMDADLRECRMVMEVLEKVQSPEKELDDLEFVKDLRIVLVKMSELVLMIAECQWPVGFGY